MFLEYSTEVKVPNDFYHYKKGQGAIPEWVLSQQKILHFEEVEVASSFLIRYYHQLLPA
jgi:hypothetical protein